MQESAATLTGLSVKSEATTATAKPMAAVIVLSVAKIPKANATEKYPMHMGKPSFIPFLNLLI